MVNIIVYIDTYRYFCLLNGEKKLSEKKKYSINIKQNYLFVYWRLFSTFYSAQGKYKYFSGLIHCTENNSAYFSRNIF